MNILALTALLISTRGLSHPDRVRPAGPAAQPRAAAAVRWALAAGRRTVREESTGKGGDYLATTRYFVVTLGRREYVYTRAGKFVRERPAKHPSAGLKENYAEIGWDIRDAKRKLFSDTYGIYLLRYRGGRWHEIAVLDGGIGYDDKDFHKAGVPSRIVKWLRTSRLSF